MITIKMSFQANAAPNDLHHTDIAFSGEWPLCHWHVRHLRWETQSQNWFGLSITSPNFVWCLSGVSQERFDSVELLSGLNCIDPASNTQQLLTSQQQNGYCFSKPLQTWRQWIVANWRPWNYTDPRGTQITTGLRRCLSCGSDSDSAVCWGTLIPRSRVVCSFCSIKGVVEKGPDQVCHFPHRNEQSFLTMFSTTH